MGEERLKTYITLGLPDLKPVPCEQYDPLRLLKGERDTSTKAHPL
jgi:hypothetical protein